MRERSAHPAATVTGRSAQRRPPLLVAAGLALLAGACASFATQLVPLPDQNLRLEDHRGARVYLVREGELPSGIKRMRVFDGARLIGYFGDNEWLCWERPPGRMILRTIAMKTLPDSPEVESRIVQELAAGDVAFVGMRVSAVDQNAVLRLIDEDEGRELTAGPPPWVD